MPGGLLNIVAYGAANIILNGNPNKTFSKQPIVSILTLDYSVSTLIMKDNAIYLLIRTRHLNLR